MSEFLKLLFHPMGKKGVDMDDRNEENGVDRWEYDRVHLEEVLTDSLSALTMLWQVVEPLLRRSMTRQLSQGVSWNYWRVSDGLKHSVEWLKAMPQRASDGTTVWEPPLEAAATNEPEVRGDQVEGRQEDADRVRRSREERHRVQDGAGTGQLDEVGRLRYQIKLLERAQAKPKTFSKRRAPRRRK